jgi:hypothetical protein
MLNSIIGTKYYTRRLILSLNLGINSYINLVCIRLKILNAQKVFFMLNL